MKRFILRLALYFVGLFVLISPLLFYKIGGDSWKYIDNPTALIIDKTERLENLSSPKIMIVGGSSSFFGMNSEILENELSKPVVNMAQFAGFGLEFILKQTENNIKQGDIVFLCSEYYLNIGINDRAMEEILKYYPPALKYFPDIKITYLDKIKNNFFNNVESIFNFILVPISRKSPIYKHSRVANKYGDNIGYLKYNNPSARNKMKKTEYSYYEGLKIIANYINNVQNKGGKVYIIFPPISESAYSLNRAVFDKYYSDYINVLGDNVLCSPKEMVFDDNKFFDTYYHLSGNAREERTKRMVGFYKRKKTTNARTHNNVYTK